MQALIEVILPVFLVVGFGYVTVWRGLFSDSVIDGLMKFTQNFAIPCLLFSAIAQLDLGQSFDWRLMVSYYSGAVAGFLAGLYGARLLFGRPWPDAVAIGFVCLYSNSVLLGLPITERAYGADALAPNFAIIALHAPICYGIGVTAMEIVRASGAGATETARRVLRSMFRNALVIGIALGFAANLTGAVLPQVLNDALDMVIRAALPAALFGVGGVLVRYRPEGDAATIAMVCAVTLVLNPSVTWGVGTLAGLDHAAFRSAVLTGAMAPGINTYIFANMYGVSKRVAASSVLIATALSILTIWVWLTALG